MRTRRRGGPGQYEERLERARQLADSAGVEQPLSVLIAVLEHQQRRTADPTVTAAGALLRARGDVRAAAGHHPLLEATDAADAVELEVAVAVRALPPTIGLPAPLTVAADALVGPHVRADAVRAWLADPALVDPTAAFWIGVAAQPIFELAAVDAPVPPRQRWTAAACPVCGGAAQVSTIAEESGEFMAGAPRSLWCSRCATSWPYPRATCVACGEDDSRRIGAWSADAWPAARIESCDSCRAYIKTFDLRASGGSHVVPLVDDVATAALDLWATGRDLHRGVVSLAGV